MTDRELLEAAAQAAGIDLTGATWHGTFVFRAPKTPNWNPLTNDGDALRLAAKLRMVLSLADCSCCAVVDWAGNPDDNEVRVRFSEEFSDCETTDAQQATRTAIVRAAAEIHRSRALDRMHETKEDSNG
jgi:hypothetical protein